MMFYDVILEAKSKAIHSFVKFIYSIMYFPNVFTLFVSEKLIVSPYFHTTLLTLHVWIFHTKQFLPWVELVSDPLS